MQHPGPAVDTPGGGDHLIGHGGGEHLAGACGVEHAEADEAAVHRFVARAAARHQTDLARHGRVFAEDHPIGVVHPQSVGVGGRKAQKRFLDDIGGVIDQLLHAAI